MQKSNQNINSGSPIGVFDSGVGGTSIWKEIVALLPNESTIYLADSKNAPYGIRSKQEIIKLCEKNTELLLKKGCKLVVVACNTATTNAIDHLRIKYSVPFIGIEPAIKPASVKSTSKVVGILATKGTLGSALFQETASLYKDGVQLLEQDGTGIVELIENGKLDSSEMMELLKGYVSPMIEKGIDYLVLGCSHYPYLIPNLKKFVPKRVTIIDSGFSVAKQTRLILEQNKLLNTGKVPGKYIFYTNRSATVLNVLLQNKQEIEEVDF
jgi:glutamate racemase